MSSKRILILSCNTGEGHNSSARCLKDTIRQEKMKCDIYDALALAGAWLSKSISSIYNFSIRYELFGIGYSMAEWYESKITNVKSPIYLLNRIYANKLYELIRINRYDAVICTHLFPSETLSFLRKKRHLAVPVFYISTDYTCYPLVKETDMDAYMIAHPDLIDDYLNKGIPYDKLYPTGIPCTIKHDVLKHSKSQIREMLNSEFGWQTSIHTGKWFLLMGGSMGFGNMDDLINSLQDRCHVQDRIICVCGRNKKMKDNIEIRYQESQIVRAIGYTDRIPELMRACDVLFTKPGGLTSTEALHYNIPIIHTKAIKGVEDKNSVFFHNRNMSFNCNDPHIQAAHAFRLCEDQSYRESILECQRKNRIHNSSHMVFEIILSKLLNK